MPPPVGLGFVCELLLLGMSRINLLNNGNVSFPSRNEKNAEIDKRTNIINWKLI